MLATGHRANSLLWHHPVGHSDPSWAVLEQSQFPTSSHRCPCRQVPDSWMERRQESSGCRRRMQIYSSRSIAPPAFWIRSISLCGNEDTFVHSYAHSHAQTHTQTYNHTWTKCVDIHACVHVSTHTHITTRTTIRRNGFWKYPNVENSPVWLQSQDISNQSCLQTNIHILHQKWKQREAKWYGKMGETFCKWNKLERRTWSHKDSSAVHVLRRSTIQDDALFYMHQHNTGQNEKNRMTCDISVTKIEKQFHIILYSRVYIYEEVLEWHWEMVRKWNYQYNPVPSTDFYLWLSSRTPHTKSYDTNC